MAASHCSQRRHQPSTALVLFMISFISCSQIPKADQRCCISAFLLPSCFHMIFPRRLFRTVFVPCSQPCQSRIDLAYRDACSSTGCICATSSCQTKPKLSSLELISKHRDDAKQHESCCTYSSVHSSLKPHVIGMLHGPSVQHHNATMFHSGRQITLRSNVDARGSSRKNSARIYNLAGPRIHCGTLNIQHTTDNSASSSRVTTLHQ